MINTKQLLTYKFQISIKKTQKMSTFNQSGYSFFYMCCMCCGDEELVDHLLLHCPVTHSLWSFVLQAFGVHWVMPRTTVSLLSCQHQWLGKHNSNIWNLIPRCLMWIVWLERNCHSFENMEKTLDELKVLCQHSLFEWARCWGFTDTLSLSEFMFSLRLSF